MVSKLVERKPTSSSYAGFRQGLRIADGIIPHHRAPVSFGSGPAMLFLAPINTLNRVLAEQLGHTTIQMTMRYAKFHPD